MDGRESWRTMLGKVGVRRFQKFARVGTPPQLHPDVTIRMHEHLTFFSSFLPLKTHWESQSLIG